MLVSKSLGSSFSYHSLRRPWLRSLRILTLSPSWLQGQNTPLKEDPNALLQMQVLF
jgi:hypothetical protein